MQHRITVLFAVVVASGHSKVAEKKERKKTNKHWPEAEGRGGTRKDKGGLGVSNGVGRQTRRTQCTTTWWRDTAERP